MDNASGGALSAVRQISVHGFPKISQKPVHVERAHMLERRDHVQDAGMSHGRQVSVVLAGTLYHKGRDGKAFRSKVKLKNPPLARLDDGGLIAALRQLETKLGAPGIRPPGR